MLQVPWVNSQTRRFLAPPTSTGSLTLSCRCPYGGLDMSPALFNYFSNPDAGVIYVSWSAGGGGGGGDNGAAAAASSSSKAAAAAASSAAAAAACES